MSPSFSFLSLIVLLAAAEPAADVTSRRQQGLEAAQKMIDGRENEPAETVFKNIELFKGMPAERVLRIMDRGWSRSLGVACDHCHVQSGWEKEDKPEKQVAREMARMTRSINEEHLRKIANLGSAQPTVNCTTCHRGDLKPALETK